MEVKPLKSGFFVHKREEDLPQKQIFGRDFIEISSKYRLK